MSRYSTVELRSDHVIKTYEAKERGLAERLCEHEVSFYSSRPWATPRLLDFDRTTLKVERLRTVTEVAAAGGLPPWTRLTRLLRDLGLSGVHHRDAHLGNVVLDRNDEPKLIDWEVSLFWRSTQSLSYDLYGSTATDVPMPPQHRKRGYATHWNDERRQMWEEGMA